MGKIYSITFHHESLYRTELYGLLAGTVVIQHIIHKISIKLPISKTLDFYCDNKSAITTITERLKLRRAVNQHRGPEVEIEQQLVYELLQLMDKKCIINICHVKGHQDDKKGTELSYEEIWNIVADRLTHIARTHADIKEYDHFPTNKFNPILNKQYINSHYAKMVNLAFHSMAL
jgi:hypothetical protein